MHVDAFIVTAEPADVLSSVDLLAMRLGGEPIDTLVVEITSTDAQVMHLFSLESDSTARNVTALQFGSSSNVLVVAFTASRDTAEGTLSAVARSIRKVLRAEPGDEQGSGKVEGVWVSPGEYAVLTQTRGLGRRQPRELSALVVQALIQGVDAVQPSPRVGALYQSRRDAARRMRTFVSYSFHDLFDVQKRVRSKRLKRDPSLSDDELDVLFSAANDRSDFPSMLHGCLPGDDPMRWARLWRKIAESSPADCSVNPRLIAAVCAWIAEDRPGLDECVARIDDVNSRFEFLTSLKESINQGDTCREWLTEKAWMLWATGAADD